jgi:hypothetical protein
VVDLYGEDSQWEDQQFFDHSPRLCTYDAMVMIDGLRQAGRSYIVYNEGLPRCGEGVPFDRDSARWRGQVFACSYEDDWDIEWNGFR